MLPEITSFLLRLPERQQLRVPVRHLVPTHSSIRCFGRERLTLPRHFRIPQSAKRYPGRRVRSPCRKPAAGRMNEVIDTPGRRGLTRCDSPGIGCARHYVRELRSGSIFNPQTLPGRTHSMGGRSAGVAAHPLSQLLRRICIPMIRARIPYPSTHAYPIPTIPNSTMNM